MLKDLKKIRKKIIENFGDKKQLCDEKNDNSVSNFNDIKNILLNTKVDDYIKWNYKNMVEGNYTEYGEYSIPIQLRNLIEKMAVWYELRFPDYEIEKMMCSGDEKKSISDIMFKDNNYNNEILGENTDIKSLDWNEFYNASVFFKSLTFEESCRFIRAKYKKIVHIDSKKISHLNLTSNGYVQEAKGIDKLSNNKISNNQLKGMHVTDVVTLLKKNGIVLPRNNELEQEILRVEKLQKDKDGLLDAVMYRIIERGGESIGPKRAFLFAKEFGRNIDIPMMYAIDYSDPGLRLFINEYLKNGGSKDLVCYVDYFNSILVDKKVDIITIQELLLTVNNDAKTFYTPEEDELHQRLVNALSNRINQDDLSEEQENIKKEEVRQLRLQRKLEKSKSNK